MTDTLTITQSQAQGSITILHLAGRLDGQTQAMLLTAARSEKAAGMRCLLIDLSNVEFITSAGLGALHN
ncbi:MAG TPA: STAS domain-containing protein, partial [Anaerolineales bacterium]